MAENNPIFRTQDTPESMRSKLNDLSRTVAGLEGGGDVDLSAITDRLDALESQTADFETRIAALEGA